MLYKTWLDFVPLLGLFAGSSILILFAIAGGYSLATFRKRHDENLDDAPISSVVGGTLGLLAFLLAFTFGTSASRFETRLQLLLDEVNAIGTCYLRAALVPDIHCDQIRQLLREYVHLRSQISQQPKRLPEIVTRSDAILDELWLHAVEVGKKEAGSEVVALFIDSLNSVIDFHTKRVVLYQYRTPIGIWIALFVVAILAMASVGYQFGMAGKRYIVLRVWLAISFSVVIWLIADLERGDQGLLQVNQQPMQDLDRKLEASQEKGNP